MVNNEDLKLVEIAENLVENIEKLVKGMLLGKSRQRVLIR